jgi:hypothetical protein
LLGISGTDDTTFKTLIESESVKAKTNPTTFRAEMNSMALTMNVIVLKGVNVTP